MISNQIFRSSSSNLTRLCYHQFARRFASVTAKDSQSSQNQSTTKSSGGKPNSEYLAADMYDYTAFSYYDMEASMTKYRLQQPSAYAPLKPPEPAPQKK